MASADLLLYILLFELVFATLFGLYSSSECSMGITLTMPPQPTSESDWLGMIFSILVYLGNGIIRLFQILTGIGIDCGFPWWFITIFQSAIFITAIYLLIPWIK